MRVLQLSYRFPYPPKDGGAIGIFNITRGLSNQGVDLTLLTVNTPKHYFDQKALPKDVAKLANWEVVDVNTQITPLNAFANLLDGKPFHVSRFEDHGFKQRLIDLLQQGSFDIIQLEGPFMGPYLNTIRANSSAKVVLRMHNIEHKIWKRLANEVSNPFKKIYINLQANRLHKYEKSLFHEVDGLVPITEQDASFLKEISCDTPYEIVPAFVDLKELDPIKYEGTWPDFFFIGGLDWMPNWEGLLWFLNQVWPKVESKYPESKFHIAGRNAPDRLKSLKSEQIVYHGEVEDAFKFMSEHGIMVVPLFSGSGMRLKIIEGLGMKKPIISTSIGSEGMSVRHDRGLLIADDAESFISEIDRLASNKAFAESLGESGNETIKQAYDIESNSKKLIEFYQTLLN